MSKFTKWIILYLSTLFVVIVFVPNISQGATTNTSEESHVGESFGTFLVDKEVDIIIGLSIGFLILFVHRRADKHIHTLIVEERKLIEEIHEMTEQERKLMEEIHEMIEQERRLFSKIDHMNHEERKIIEEIREMNNEERKIIEELRNMKQNR